MNVAVYACRNPEAPEQFLDAENLVSIELGCFNCEEPYSPELAARPCPGEIPARQ